MQHSSARLQGSRLVTAITHWGSPQDSIALGAILTGKTFSTDTVESSIGSSGGAVLSVQLLFHVAGYIFLLPVLVDSLKHLENVSKTGYYFLGLLTKTNANTR